VAVAIDETDERHAADFYRDTAAQLRLVAARFGQADVKAELLELALRFDKLAAYAASRAAWLSSDPVDS
jgi:hypothetical protein